MATSAHAARAPARASLNPPASARAASARRASAPAPRRSTPPRGVQLSARPSPRAADAPPRRGASSRAADAGSSPPRGASVPCAAAGSSAPPSSSSASSKESGRGRGGAIQSALTSSGDASEILALVAERASAFDAIHAATAIHRVATHVAKDRRGGVEDPKTRAKEEALMNSDAFRTLQTLVLANLPKMNAQGLANVAWAFAKMERDPGADALAAIAAGLAAELGKNAKPRANDGGRRSSREHHGGVRPQAVSNTLWAFGQLDYSPAPETLHALCEGATPLLRAFRAQELSNTFLGLARIEHDPGNAFCGAAFASASANLRSFEEQETSNLLWACARLQRAPPRDLFDALLEQSAAQNLGGMASGANLSQCLWACAKLDMRPPEAYFRAVEAEIPRCAGRLQPEHLDCVLWALASMNARVSEEARMALSSAAARLAPRMDAELLVKTHWAFARLRARPSPGDTRLIVDAARRLVGDLEEDDRLTVMHAWGVLRINPGDDVVRAFTETFRSSVEGSAEGSAEGSSSDVSPEASLDGADCAKLLCAYGRTRHQPPAAHAAALAKRLAEAAAEDELHPSAAVLGLWGASLLGLRMGTDQLDALARDAMTHESRLPPRSLAKIVWALAALGYDPTRADLATLRERAAAAMPRLAAKDQEALREAMHRLGDRGFGAAGGAEAEASSDAAA